MSCKDGSCGSTGGECKCGGKARGVTCSAECDGSQLRLEALRRREPGCGPSRCEKGIVWRPDCRDIAERLVAAGVAKLFRTKQGAALAFSNGLTVLVSDLCNDNPFGLPFNCERRASEFSWSDVAQVMDTYAFEPISTEADFAGVAAVPGVAGWYYIRLGGLGVSHAFCLKNISITADIAGGATGVPVIPVGVGVGGETIACGDGETGDEGSYVRVWERPTRANPSAIQVTEGRCECTELCAWTPARGGEAFYFATPVDLVITSVVATFEVTRCSWLSDNPKGCCVESVNGRTASIAPGYDGALRAEPGAQPFLPPVL